MDFGISASAAKEKSGMDPRSAEQAAAARFHLGRRGIDFGDLLQSRPR